MGSKSRKPQGLRGPESHAQTRFLLALWDLGGAEVRKGDVMKKVVRTGEKVADYQPVLSTLENGKNISVTKAKVSLTPEGLDLLGQGLSNSDFQFDSQIGAPTANALLKWIRQGNSSNGAVKPPQSSNGKAEADVAIASYEDFKPVVLDVYDRLNRDYNYDNLVPIYRIRREVGEKTTRSQFNDWMLEAQSNGIFQLLEGTVEDSAPDKIEDSVTTKLGKLRCYAKRTAT